MFTLPAGFKIIPEISRILWLLSKSKITAVAELQR
jgi:hypothetical protein